MTETAIFEEQNLGFSYLDLFSVYGSAVMPPPFTLSLGETYKVVWDGGEYEVTAIDTSAVIPNSIAIGNGANWGFPGNNEPFVIVYTADSDVSFISLTDTEPSTHAVAVYRKSEDTAIYTINPATLTAIADAIRAKTGGTDKILPGDMATAIEGITTGGGSSDDVRYVTFMNGDKVHFVKAVATGDDCVDVVARGLVDAPTQESTEQYEYSLIGWSAEDGGEVDPDILKNITENKAVYAVYEEKVRNYTIIYVDDDGTTVLHTEQLPYGSVPSYKPEKDGYMFVSLTPTPVAVTRDATYQASWVQSITIVDTSVSVNSINYAASVSVDSFSYAKGDNYIVEFDGETYECNVLYVKFTYGSATNSNKFYGLGNPYKQYVPGGGAPTKVNDASTTYGATISDNGMPFWVDFGMATTATTIRVYDAGAATNHTIKISKVA